MQTADPRRWAELRLHFEALADLDAAARAQRLAELAARDPAMAEEVAEFLHADATRGDDDPLTARLGGAVQVLAAELGLGTDDSRPAWLGEYRILDTLGSGGMGVVYLAEQQAPRRSVALKVIRGGDGEAAIRRFRREAELHGRLQHPNIAQVYEAGVADERDASGVARGHPRSFFAMEFVAGESLIAAAQRRGLSIAERVELMARVCDAIEHAHAHGVIHRDLKSANILVDSKGQPKVLDFGIAKALDRDHAATLQTAVGEVVGTLPYMSPEQVAGDPATVGVRSDVYALGVILYELLSGRRPLELGGRSIPDAVRVIVDQEPTRLGSAVRTLRGDLETMVGKCLEKDPEHRYDSAGALAADLRRFLSHRPIEARPASTLYQLSKFARRNRPLVTGVATAFVAMVAATAVSITMAVRATTARTEAQEAKSEIETQLRYAQIENRRSSQSFAFLSDLLTAADPSKGLPPDITVRDFVRHAADALERGAGEEAQVTGLIARLIGLTLESLGDLEGAERAYRRSVALMRLPDPNAVGSDHTLYQSMANLAGLLRTSGRVDEAEALLREIIELRERSVAAAPGPILGPGISSEADAYRAVALNDLGLIEMERRNFVEAERLLERAHAMELELVRLGHHRQRAVAIGLYCLGRCRIEMDRDGESIPLLRRSLRLIREIDGADSALAQRIDEWLAAALLRAGRYREAIAHYEHMLAARGASGPSGTASRLEGAERLAGALLSRGEALRALAIASDAVAEARAMEMPASGQFPLLLAHAGALSMTGDHDGAWRSLDLAEAQLTAAGETESRRAQMLTARATAARLGRRPDARAIALEAVHFQEHPSLEGRRLHQRARREAALSLVTDGDPSMRQDAIDELTRLIDELRNAPADRAPILAQALLSLSEIELLAGHRESAAAHASDASTLLAVDDHEAALPWMSAYAALIAQDAEAGGVAAKGGAASAVADLHRQIREIAGGDSPDHARVNAVLARRAAPDASPRAAAEVSDPSARAP